MVSRLFGWNRTDAGQERHLFSAPESWRKRLQAIRLWRPLLVTKTGSKLWRYAFNFDSKQKLLALGQYPVTSLADARIKCDDAKKLLAEGIDPSVNRKEERRNARMARANTFDALAKELMDKSEARRTRPGPQSSATVNAPSGSEPAPATFPPLDFSQNPASINSGTASRGSASRSPCSQRTRMQSENTTYQAVAVCSRGLLQRFCRSDTQMR
jgi:hypothetical protein